MPTNFQKEYVVGIRQRVEKNLQSMPQSPTASPLVIYRWHCQQPIFVGIL